MPIVTFYLTKEEYPAEAIRQLLIEASHFYCDTLYATLEPKPLDRVRAFVVQLDPQLVATAGQLVSEGAPSAPYFTCLALDGRPDGQLGELMAGFTDLLVKHLGSPRELIRGQVVSINPAHWSIGGEPASIKRRDESALRSGVAKPKALDVAQG